MKENQPLHSMRLDKWLWCARFFKTRALATAAIKGNRVKVDGVTAKPSKNIQPGDVLLIRKPPFEFGVTVLKLSPNRLSGSLALQLYEESTDSIAQRELLSSQLKAESAAFPRTRGRPTKRDRRHIIRFTRIDSETGDD